MTARPDKLRVAVLYGGRSTEHEVSLRSAASVIATLDRNRYEIIPISVDRSGRFHRQDLARALAVAQQDPARLPMGNDEPSGDALTVAPRPAGPLFTGGTGHAGIGIDVVFPVMHGPLCEDGSLQGLLELADVPYVGCRVLGSAVCMDKDIAKRLVRAEGIGIAEYVCFTKPRWQVDSATFIARIEAELGYPAFVKPATLGSSVGVSRARDRAQLMAAVEQAFEFDDKLLVERAIDAREIEVAVLAARDPSALPDTSVPGEINAAEAFYSFERKYLESAGADLRIPASIDAAQTARVRELAARAFVALECEGMARIDFFLDRKSGEFLFNETNTIPGFTSISMYPKLWEATGVPYATLLDRLLEDALRRHERRANLRRER